MQVCANPEDIEVANVKGLKIGEGVFRKSEESDSSPSWPLPLAPQQATVPSSRITHA